MIKKPHKITHKDIERYLYSLGERERSDATIQKYTHDLTLLLDYLDGRPPIKTILIRWKENLVERYAPATVNSILAAVNGFFSFMGWKDLTIKLLAVQKSPFRDEGKELTQEEYTRLVRVAENTGKKRLSLVLQTICATGIRVSELKYITVEAVHSGRARVNNKGKRRMVFLPENLRRLLRKYLQKQKITAGAVFITRGGKTLDRSNIWRDMKTLCKSAGVEPGKVFPHNLRHLFARTYYKAEKDLSRLADILGHSNVNTTRIYTAESGLVHARQIEQLGLVLTT